MVIDFKDGKIENCKQDFEKNDGLYEDGCIFLPNRRQSSNLTTSMMSHHYLSQVGPFLTCFEVICTLCFMFISTRIKFEESLNRQHERRFFFSDKLKTQHKNERLRF